MRKSLLFPLFFFPIFAWSQSPDSLTAVRQIDSMLQQLRPLIEKKQFEAAFSLADAAQEKIESAFGKLHAKYAVCMGLRGKIYQHQERFEEAAAAILEATATLEKIQSRETPAYSTNLGILSSIYLSMGDYTKAEPVLLETQALRAKLFGKSSPEYGRALLNLAAFYKHQADFDLAESSELEALEIMDKSLGKRHPDYIRTLANLGSLCLMKGDFQKALPLYLEANDGFLALGGKNNPMYIQNAGNLGALYSQMGDKAKAKQVYLELMDSYVNGGDGDNVVYYLTMGNLSNIYVEEGDYARAEQLLLEAKAGLLKILDADHPKYLGILSSLGALYITRKEFDKAEPLLREVSAAAKIKMGAEHPFYLDAILQLATVFQQTGRIPEARALYLELGAGVRRRLEKSAGYSAEAEQFAYLKNFQRFTRQSYSFAQKFPLEQTAGEAYNSALFYKGFLLNTAIQLKNRALADTASAMLFERLSANHRRLTLQYAEPVAERDSNLVANLESKALEMEKELARTVLGFGDALQQVNWREVQAALKPGEAAVEFVHYQYQENKKTDSTMYAALLLRPGMSEPVFLTLFEARELLPMLKGASGGNYRKINALYAVGAAGQNSLYDLVWARVEPLLDGVTKVYCSVSGLLHQVNLGAIPLNARETFSERRQLVLLGSTRQLVLPEKRLPQNKSALLVGGVRYNADHFAIEEANRQVSRAAGEQGLAAPMFEIDSLTRGDAWRFLPASLAEVLDLQSIMKVNRFQVHLDTGYAATEESVKYFGQNKKNAAPRVLHFATHGFFFPNPKTQSSDRFSDQTISYKSAENPLLRSGIVLAGAQEIWTSGKPPAEREDGVLTAYEISSMNLSATELVVLSACETGLGDIEGDEGVYGLQRAFKIAGAKYVLMSLWKVNDQTTREFMAEFYGQWLKKGLGIPEAFRNAQLKMRQKYPGEGYHWAGWVLTS